MRIAVIGAGALGSLCAGLLSVTVLDEVWLLGSPEFSGSHLAAIEKNGLEIELAPPIAAGWQVPPGISAGPDGLYRTTKLKIATDPEQIHTPVELALILVKSYQTERAATQAAQLLAGTGLALTLQNGLGNAEILSAVLGAGRVSQGVTLLGSILEEPGRVRFSGLGPTALGSPPGLTQLAINVVADFAARWEKLALPVSISAEVDGLVWGKLVVNCAINPLTALLNCRNGELLDDPNTLKLLDEAATEAARVGLRLGVQLPFPVEEAADWARQAALATVGNISSMLADVRRGRLTEIEMINGAVVRLGHQLRVATPVNNSLYAQIKALQRETAFWPLKDQNSQPE